MRGARGVLGDLQVRFLEIPSLRGGWPPGGGEEGLPQDLEFRLPLGWWRWVGGGQVEQCEVVVVVVAGGGGGARDRRYLLERPPR